MRFLFRHPCFIWPTVINIVDLLNVKLFTCSTARSASALADPEVDWFECRGGWLVDDILAFGSNEALLHYGRMIARTNLAEDTYSASQRIAALTYLLHLNGRASLPSDITERGRQDAFLVARNYEFRRGTTWFNNHLLNNYRALLLYASYFMGTQDKPEIEKAIRKIGDILEKHWNTIFETQSDPIVCEGSVSYEIYGLKMLTDMAVCRYRTPLSNIWQEWVISRGKSTLMKYRYKNRWIVPQIGDLTPNWTPRGMLDFMDGLAFPDSSSTYRAVWQKDLARLGI